jgi:hypothetical protein
MFFPLVLSELGGIVIKAYPITIKLVKCGGLDALLIVGLFTAGLDVLAALSGTL